MTKRQRFLNSDGSIQVLRKGIQYEWHQDFYHKLLSLSWQSFIAVMVGVFLTLNGIFACLYFLCSPQALHGVNLQSSWTRFTDGFFFSVQTLATIGYGAIHPTTLVSNVLVSIEAFLGFSFLAIATGILFAKFSRPQAKVLFSDVCIVRKKQGISYFMFRASNARNNIIVEAQVSVTLALTETNIEGDSFRNVMDLKLVRTKTPLFNIMWTLMHPIDSDSPFLNKTKEELSEGNAEIIVSLTGLDETFGQTVHARKSYILEDIRWNHVFEDMITFTKDKIPVVDLAKIHAVKTINPNITD